MTESRSYRWLTGVALLQGAYWLLTGLWPLLHMRSFLFLTGPKDDLWLVRTVSVLISIIGLVLLLAGLRRRVTVEIMVLGIASAAGLAFIDVFYTLRDVIWNIYLADAAGEAAIITLWAWAGFWSRQA